jgi:hypothetical protein
MNSTKKTLLVLATVTVLAVVITVPFYELSVTKGSASTASTDSSGTGTASSNSTSTNLPAGCVKPPGGFLIVASDLGYNDSELHYGAGSWPVINVTQGSTVTITVCNTANYAHGFQISGYYQGSLVTIAPGEVLHIPAFVADKAGNFLIYCSIPCPIHIYMQYGELSVAS